MDKDSPTEDAPKQNPPVRDWYMENVVLPRWNDDKYPLIPKDPNRQYSLAG